MIFQRLHHRCGAAAAPSAFALAGTERQYERPRPFRLHHLFLDLTLDLTAKAVEGSARWDFERIAAAARWLSLDAVGFDVFGVDLMSGSESIALQHEYDGDELRIAIPNDVHAGSVVIRYRAVPREGLYFLEPDAAVPERPVQVWSQCQDENARHWFPCHDKPHVKMTTELRVGVPSGFVVLSNGEFVNAPASPGGTDSPQSAHSAEPAASLEYFHFRLDQPHPSYLMTLVVGRFAVLDDRPAQLADGREIPVRYYVPPSRVADGLRTFGQTPRMLELISRLTGVPYPWPRYSQVVVSDFVFGGMENTTATTMYEHILVDERASIDIPSEDLVAHELAHQWFGDYVTCRDWSEAWLNEGFATFFEHVEIEDRLGVDEYEWGVSRDLESYENEASGSYQRPIVCRDWALPMDLFDRHLYEKGGLVLHMLRRLLGDGPFWAGVQRYLTDHAFGIVETRDLQRALEASSGLALDRFFDQWVFRPGHPELAVKVEWNESSLDIRVAQKQKIGDVALFQFELEVDVAFDDGAFSRHSKVIETAEDAITIHLARRPKFVVIDPEFKIATPISLEAPADMLRAQLAGGVTARQRWVAADALATRVDVPTVRSLVDALNDTQAPWMVRARVALALGRTRAPEAFAALTAAVGVDHPKVRRAVVAALGEFRNEAALHSLEAAAASDPSYLVEAAALKALGSTRQSSALPILELGAGRKSWNDVVRAGALDGMAELGAPEAAERVRELTRYGVPSRGRRAAAMALAKLRQDRHTRQHLESLLDDRELQVRITAVQALVELGDARARDALQARLGRERDARVTRTLRVALRDLAEVPEKATKRLSDEMGSLERKLAELRLRVTRLEPTEDAPEPAKNSAAKKGTALKRPASARTASRSTAPAKHASSKTVTRATSPKTRTTETAGARRATVTPRGFAKKASPQKSPSTRPSAKRTATKNRAARPIPAKKR